MEVRAVPDGYEEVSHFPIRRPQGQTETDAEHCQRSRLGHFSP